MAIFVIWKRHIRNQQVDFFSPLRVKLVIIKLAFSWPLVVSNTLVTTFNLVLRSEPRVTKEMLTIPRVSVAGLIAASS